MDCPCRVREEKQIAYSECCEPWHKGFVLGSHAPTALALMRSRYSAYALAKRNDAQGKAMLQYLLSTWHVSSLPSDLEISPTQWVGLDVQQHSEEGDAALVEFVAHFKVNGKAEHLHEISRFFRLDGAWQYLDGDVQA